MLRLVILSLCVAQCGTLLSSFLPGGGGRTPNCVNWSRWEESDCFATNDRLFIEHMPGAIVHHTIMQALLINGRGFLKRSLDYFEFMNMSSTACGMCNVRISCAESCDSRQPGNAVGVSDQVCTELAGHDSACVMHKSAFEYGSLSCHMWPPRNRDLDLYIPRLLPPPYKDILVSADPFNCISIDTRCYCCCEPFRPDPCTAKCVQDPCSRRTRFTATEITQLNG